MRHQTFVTGPSSTIPPLREEDGVVGAAARASASAAMLTA